MGLITHCTGKRRLSRSRSEAISTVSRCSSSSGPSYQGMLVEGSTTLSPCSAEIGITHRSGSPSSVSSAAISWNRSCDQSTRSILLTATTACGTRRIERMYVCRRVCSTTPWRASTSTIPRSAVDAPVTMLRVYWTWPGASASWKRRFGVTNERYATSIVIPCSRSARRPSVSSARSTYSLPRRRETSSMCASWSTKICFVSYRRRPISVDLPSSTEPQVTRRRSSVERAAASEVSEVADTLTVLHRGLAETVVGARLAALGDARRRDLRHHLLDRPGLRLDAAGAGHVADGAEADGGAERLFARQALHVGRDGVQHPVAAEHLALVGEVDRGQLEPLAGHVLPDVELRPVRDREDADVLALADAGVVQVPQLGPLGARVPLAELVAEGEDPLLRPAALLVAAGAADRGVEAVLGDRIEQRRRLQPVAGGAGSGLLYHPALVDRLLHRGHDQPLAELGHAAVAELDRLGEVVAGVDVHDREGEAARAEGLLGEPGEDEGRRLRGRLPGGVQPQLGLGGLLVRRRHPGELVDLAGEGRRVEPLRVAAGALLERGGDVDLDERRVLLDEGAGVPAGLLVGRDGRDDHGGPGPRQARRDPADARDVRVAVVLREAEPLREVGADDVAVEVVDDEASPLELRLDDVRDRRLAGPG